MSHGVLLTAIGVVVGGGAALGLTRLLGDLLYKTSPRDPAAFGVAFVVMSTASIARNLRARVARLAHGSGAARCASRSGWQSNAT